MSPHVNSFVIRLDLPPIARSAVLILGGNNFISHCSRKVCFKAGQFDKKK